MMMITNSYIISNPDMMLVFTQLIYPDVLVVVNGLMVVNGGCSSVNIGIRFRCQSVNGYFLFLNSSLSWNVATNSNPDSISWLASLMLLATLTVNSSDWLSINWV